MERTEKDVNKLFPYTLYIYILSIIPYARIYVYFIKYLYSIIFVYFVDGKRLHRLITGLMPSTHTVNKTFLLLTLFPLNLVFSKKCSKFC